VKNLPIIKYLVLLPNPAIFEKAEEQTFSVTGLDLSIMG